jgi:hypothetical protein
MRFLSSALFGLSVAALACDCAAGTDGDGASALDSGIDAAWRSETGSGLEAGVSDASDADDGATLDGASVDGAGADGTDGADGAGADGAGAELLVFVTSQQYTGNLGGLTGADTLCQNLATAAGLPGNYKAWLSDSITTAAQRLTQGTLAYKLVDHTLVANNWTELTSGKLQHAIDKTESGGSPPTGLAAQQCGGIGPQPTVWTDTLVSGALAQPSATCSDWTSTSPTVAFFGLANHADSNWTSYCSVPAAGACAWQSALYCIQQ